MGFRSDAHRRIRRWQKLREWNSLAVLTDESYIFTVFPRRISHFLSPNDLRTISPLSVFSRFEKEWPSRSREKKIYSRPSKIRLRVLRRGIICLTTNDGRQFLSDRKNVPPGYAWFGKAWTLLLNSSDEACAFFKPVHWHLIYSLLTYERRLFSLSPSFSFYHLPMRSPSFLFFLSSSSHTCLYYYVVL